MYKIRIVQVHVNDPLVMWIVSDLFLEEVWFIKEEEDFETGTYAGNDFRWQPSNWVKYL